MKEWQHLNVRNAEPQRKEDANLKSVQSAVKKALWKNLHSDLKGIRPWKKKKTKAITDVLTVVIFMNPKRDVLRTRYQRELPLKTFQKTIDVLSVSPRRLVS